MKIKRFHAKDMRSTIRKVRKELGADAVILSNRRAVDGVEIIAAIDYDESLLDSPVPAVSTGSRDDGSKIDAADPEIVASAEETVSALSRDRDAHDDLPDVYSEAALNRRPNQSRQPAFAAPDFRLPEMNDEDEVDLQNTGFRETPFISEPLINESPAPQQTAKTETQASAHNWSEEPSILAMQEELKSLRGLLVNQLSGLAWGQETRYHPLRARLLQRLLALGLSPVLARDIAAQCDENDEIEKNWRCALARIAKRLPVVEQDILEQGGIVALVGATGVGKTTTVAKLAARYTLRYGPQKVLLITTDNNRVAAHEQLRSYARILGVPMRVAGDTQTLKSLIHGFASKGLILIDTAGMSQRDMALNKQLSMITDGARGG
ncbi:MAG TPA: flagellar biosynthesis protein FlhF, partial [Gammaproteobacteria bacterium]|nr:flagellar biosynthesis protein FlhF [Gammaproteobacteria bacterium]